MFYELGKSEKQQSWHVTVFKPAVMKSSSTGNLKQERILSEAQGLAGFGCSSMERNLSTLQLPCYIPRENILGAEAKGLEERCLLINFLFSQRPRGSHDRPQYIIHRQQIWTESKGIRPVAQPRAALLRIS
jgi:hypothetical protein